MTLQIFTDISRLQTNRDSVQLSSASAYRLCRRVALVLLMTSTASQTTRYKTALLNTPAIADTDGLPPTEITLFKAVFLTDRFQCFFHVDLPCIVRLGFGLVYASIVICAYSLNLAHSQ